MNQPIDTAYVEIQGRGFDEVAQQVTLLKEHVRSETEEAGKQGGKGLLKGLKDAFGERSSLALGGKLLAGGGALAGFEVLARGLSTLGKASSEAAEGLKKGELTAAGATGQIVLAIPVIGSMAKGINDLKAGVWDLAAAYAKSQGASKAYVDALVSDESRLADALAKGEKQKAQLAGLHKTDALTNTLTSQAQGTADTPLQAAIRKANEERAKTEEEIIATYGESKDGGKAREQRRLADLILKDKINQANNANDDKIFKATTGAQQKEDDEKKKSADEALKSLQDELDLKMLVATQGKDAAEIEAARKKGYNEDQIKALVEIQRLTKEQKLAEEENAEIIRQQKEDRRDAEAIVEKGLNTRERLLKDIRKVARLEASGDLTAGEADDAAQRMINEANGKLGKKSASTEDALSFANSLRNVFAGAGTETAAMEKERIKQQKRSADAAVALAAEFKKWGSTRPLVFAGSFVGTR